MYSRCTPNHDVRGKVALCLAHLYVTEPLRDVTQTKRYLLEVCQLAEAEQRDLSDTGLIVLMTAIQHRVQLEGWASDRVTSVLEWAQQVNDVIITVVFFCVCFSVFLSYRLSFLPSFFLSVFLFIYFFHRWLSFHFCCSLFSFVCFGGSFHMVWFVCLVPYQFFL